jgi:hypothetical protein
MLEVLAIPQGNPGRTSERPRKSDSRKCGLDQADAFHVSSNPCFEGRFPVGPTRARPPAEGRTELPSGQNWPFANWPRGALSELSPARKGGTLELRLTYASLTSTTA